MAVVAQPVCMRFSQREVHAQWQRLRAAATQFLQPIGMFDSGNASDGAATRAVLQLREMQQFAPAHHLAFTLNAAHFMYSAMKVIVNGQLRSVTYMHSQEYVRCAVARVRMCACALVCTPGWQTMTAACVCVHVCMRACVFGCVRVCFRDSYMHNGKKLISHATRVNKQLYLNGGIVDLNVFALLERADVQEAVADLLKNFRSIDAVNHVDAQSVDHMVQLCAVDATEALRQLGGDTRTASTTATAFWMELTRRYLLVFQSRRWSLLERVRQAARIVVFLRVMRRHVQLSDGLNLEHNFLCNQTYTHVLLSLHTVSVVDVAAGALPAV